MQSTSLFYVGDYRAHMKFNINWTGVDVLWSTIILDSHQQVWLLCSEYKHLQVSQQFCFPWPNVSRHLRGEVIQWELLVLSGRIRRLTWTVRTRRTRCQGDGESVVVQGVRSNVGKGRKRDRPPAPCGSLMLPVDTLWCGARMSAWPRVTCGSLRLLCLSKVWVFMF